MRCWFLFFFLLVFLTSVSWQMYSKIPRNMNLCYKDYSTIDRKKRSSFLKVKCIIKSYILFFQKEKKINLGSGVTSTLVFVQHNIGFLLNIIIPGQTFTCLHAFSPKMAAIGKRMMAQKEKETKVEIYINGWYCLPNSSTAYTLPFWTLYTHTSLIH